MAQSELHISIDEVESTVLTLYRPQSSPQAIFAAQASLSRLQSSPAAWSIACELLQRPDEHARFYGILIIIVKLNSDSAALQDQEALELLSHLLEWYQQSLHNGNGPLVVRKIASALATFFIHFHRLWLNFVPHVVICLGLGAPCTPSAVPEDDVINNHLLKLSVPQTRACLWAVTNIVEEAFKIDLNSDKHAGIYDAVRQNVYHAAALMIRGFTHDGATPELREDAIRCLQSWISFADKASPYDRYAVESLRPLISTVIETVSTDTATEASLEVLEELLSNHPMYLSPNHRAMLFDLFSSDWSQKNFQRLLQANSDFDSLLYGQLLIAFADAEITFLLKSTDDRSQKLLSSLCQLLTAEGYPGVEDRIFVPCVEFWSTFAGTVVDEMEVGDNAPQAWVNPASNLALQAATYAWQRVTFPPPHEFRQWDSHDRMVFNDARKDVTDLLQSVYALSGPRLVIDFSRIVLDNLSNSYWLKLEAAIFCLCGLADCAKEDTRCDDALSSVFSSLYAVLQHNSLGAPPRVRQAAVSLIEDYTEYFQRNPTQIPSALNLLFSINSEQTMTITAAKSIYRLCTSCRPHLHTQTGAFLEEYNQLSLRQRLDCVCGEKIIGAIACIAQAIPNEEARLSACRQLLQLVQENVNHCLEGRNNTSSATKLMCLPGSRCVDEAEEEKPALHLGLRSLRFLVSIARGFQNPSDIAIDVDDDMPGSFEPNPTLHELQQIIVAIILQVQNIFSTDAHVIELICNMLRAGFSESQPSPFKLPPRDVAEYLTRHKADTPRIGLLVKAACSFINSLQICPTNDRYEIISRVALWVTELTRGLVGPDSDPELTQVAIEFMSHLISHHAMILFQLQPANATEFIFFFSLQVLDGREPLPKMAACEFWTTFVAAKGMESEAKGASELAMNTLGPLLCQILMRNIGGNASRSELDRLCEPVKKLVVRYPSAKSWLEAGLSDQSFPSTKVTAEEKSLFVKKLISLRGSRQTNQVVRNFWLSSRGSNFAYVS